MTKIDSLLKKVELFERLAVYGDRKTFLQALAQLAGDLSPELKGQLQSALKDFTALNLNRPNVEGPILDALNGKADKGVLVSALETGLGGMSRSSHGPQVQRIQNLITSLKGTVPNLAPSGDTVTKLTTPTSTKLDPGTVNMLQVFLNQAFRPQIEAGEMGPIRQDDIWGPETAGRLREWAQLNNLPTKDLTSLVNVVKNKALA